MSTVSVIIEESDSHESDYNFNGKSSSDVFAEIDEGGELQSEDHGICSDDEYDTDIEIEDTKETYDATGRRAYFEACKRLNTTPVSYFLKNMGETEINLPYRGVGSLGVKAIAAALVVNTVTLKIDLTENYIGCDGSKTLCEMLKENCYINEVNLSMNYLGAEGCRRVCEMLQQNINLAKIDISRNNFGDSVGPYLMDAFKNNFKVAWMNLSGNNLSEKAGAALGPGINANDAMEYLNLSWNQLRCKATHEIALGLRANCTLKCLDLSWNGFSNEGTIGLADALKANNTLTELNISNNRIGIDGALVLAKGLDVNNTLEILKLDGNPISCRGAYALLTSVNNKSDSAIRELHMKDVSVHEDFIQLYDQVRSSKDVIVHAGFRVPSPLEKLQQFIKSSKDDWLAAFADFDESVIYRIPADEFIIGLQKLGFEFTTEELIILFGKLKKDSHGRIKYRDTLLGFSKEPPDITIQQKSL